KIHVIIFYFLSSRRRHTRSKRDWSSDVCSSDLNTDIVQLQEEHDELKAKIAYLKNILDNHDALLNVIKDELNEIKNKYKQKRLSSIEAEISEIKIDKEVMVPSENVMVSITKHGYIKRTSLRSFNASGVEEPGVKDGDMMLKYQEANTLDTALVFTNKGRYLYIPVHKLSEIKWKDLGQHVSQIVQIDEDEYVIDDFCEIDFKTEAFYILATRNGMIKKSNVSMFKTSRYNKPLVSMKLKGDDEIIDVMRIEDAQILTAITY